MAGMEYEIRPRVVESGLNSVNRVINTARIRFDALETRGSGTYRALDRRASKLATRQRELNNELNKSPNILRKIVSIGAGYLGLRSIFSGLDLSSDVAENNSKLNAVFGDSTKIVRSTIAGMEDSLNLGRVTLQKDFANMGAIFSGLGFSGQSLVKNTENSLKAAYDAASFHNLTFERSINAIRGAVLGESEALKAATGIIVQDTTMSEYADQLGYVWKNLNNAQKAQLRLNYIFEQLQKQGAVNDLKRTADGYANVSRAIKETTTDIRAGFFTALKDELLPTLITTRDYLSANKDTIAAYGSILGKSVGFVLEHKTAIGVLAGAYLTYKAVIGGAFAIQRAMDAWTVAKTTFAFARTTYALIGTQVQMGLLRTQTFLYTAAQKGLTVAQWALNAAMSANPIGLVVGGIALLTGGVVLAYKKFKPFKDLVDKTWKRLRDNPISGFVAQITSGIRDFLKEFAPLRKVLGIFGIGNKDKGNKKIDISRTDTIEPNYPRIDVLGPDYSKIKIPNYLESNYPEFPTTPISIPNATPLQPQALSNIVNNNNTNSNTNQFIINVDNSVDGGELEAIIKRKVEEGTKEYNSKILSSLGGGGY